MLTAAVREQHDSTVKYLLKIFPDAGIGAGVTKAAFSHLSIPIWTPPHTRLLVSEQQEGQTPIHTFFPGLLGLRARLAVAHAHAQVWRHPNDGGFGHLSNLTVAMKKAADGTYRTARPKWGGVERRAKNGGSLQPCGYCQCLLDNGVAPGGNHGDVMAAAEKVGSVDLI